MLNRSPRAALVLFTLVIATGPLCAQGMMESALPPPYLYMPVDENTTQTNAQAFDDVDANGDGVLSKSEYDGSLDESFKRKDKNGDGVITPNEVSNTPQARKASNAMDKNQDGAVTQQEFQIHSAEWYEQHDLNKDGSLNKSEVSAQ